MSRPRLSAAGYPKPAASCFCGTIRASMKGQNGPVAEEIEPGTVVGRYTILERIGQGGMGTVHRAHDPQLGRDVAVKMIRSSPEDPLRSRAFEREARATAALTHPNLVTVHDVGHSRHGPFLVYELLVGETLLERIHRGDLTPRKAVDFGIQLAEGLNAAHVRGVVHGDLTARNVFVTREGGLKILDFGLAHLRSAAQADSPVAGDEPTASGLSHPRLQGTAGYMAPERVLGGEGDARSDIFSLGVVLFEMLAGRRPFAGPSPAAVFMAAVTEDPPPLAGRHVPAALRAVVAHCLEKRPEERFQSARDVALALRAVFPPEDRRPAVPLLLGLAALTVAGLVFVFRPRARPPAPAAEPVVAPLTSTHRGSEVHPALSRDGSRVAFSWDPDDGNFDIYARATAQPGIQRLTTAPERDCCPAWSPDGSTIAFIRVLPAGGELRTVGSRGGDERLLRRVPIWFGSSVAFSADGGSIVFSDVAALEERRHALFRLDVASGRAEALTSPPPGAADGFGVFSPDGGRLAFARIPTSGEFDWTELHIAPADGGRTRRVARIEKVVGGLAWTPAGDELVYSAARFDDTPRLWRVDLSGGDPRLVGEDPPLATALGAEAITDISRALRFSIAPGGDALAYARSTYDTNIWRASLDDLSLAPVQVVASTRVDEAPQYSPDGSRIAFSSTRESRHSQIWVCAAAAAPCEQITFMDEPCGTPRWSPGAERLAFDCTVRGQSDVFVAEVASRVVRRLTMDAHQEVVPSWSRDGRSVYYASDRSGQWDVWRTAAGGGGDPARVTTRGGFAAFEGTDGRQVYYTKQAIPGLFVADSQGERQLAGVPRCWGYWGLGRDAAYVADAAREDRMALLRVPLDGSAARRLGTLPGTWACGESGLALSPDERALLYVAAARGSDVMLMRSFR
jgi:eukaryotic-like serine/threonine-protein kinase